MKEEILQGIGDHAIVFYYARCTAFFDPKAALFRAMCRELEYEEEMAQARDIWQAIETGLKRHRHLL